MPSCCHGDHAQLLLLEDSEQYDVFSEEDRQELLFRVFKHLALGGPVNQVCMLASPVYFTILDCNLYNICPHSMKMMFTPISLHPS